jgi:hypothetical protein
MTTQAPVKEASDTAVQEQLPQHRDAGADEHSGEPASSGPEIRTGPSAARRFKLAGAAALRGLVLRLVRPVVLATIVAGMVIAVGIVFEVLDANAQKWLVSDIESAAKWLTGPFQNTFLLHSAKLAIALNWALAILVYAILGRVVVAMVQRIAAQLARVR